MSIAWESNLLSSGVCKELAERIPEIIQACKDQGLDPYDLAIEEYNADEIAEIAAYGGFPVRYPHFSFGQSYESLHHQYHTGQGKIYEMVVNNDPTYMYLQRNNPMVDNLTVVAHALAHSDFFKNNIMFKHTNRNMMNVFANHGQKIRKYIDLYGYNTVMDFVDACLSVDDLIDPSSEWKTNKLNKPSKVEFDELPKVETIDRIETTDYMDKFINTEQDKENQRKHNKLVEKHAKKTFPVKPQRDVLLWVLKYVPMEQWKQNVLSMIRDEAIYYQPQIVTKVMNEGWASYWDSYMMATCGFAGDEGIFNYAKHHAGVLGGKHNMGNPYKLGVTLFNDIKERWDKGQHGKEWEECEVADKKRRWNNKQNRGTEKIFEVRELYNDYTFINEFFTRDFCEKHEFFEYKLDRDKNEYVIESRDYDKIKAKLLKKYENGGRPVITLENLKYKTSEVLLRHQFDGMPLDTEYAKQTLKMLYKIIGRPINIKTIDVEVLQSTSYSTRSSTQMYFGFSKVTQPAVDEISKTPIIMRYDGVRHTRIKDEKSARQAATDELFDI
jgi:stage V sporulation protein R